jgi:hypothetical protein
MATYALVDASGNIQNTIAWDGVTPFTPPDGQKLVKVPDGAPASTGGTYLKGVWTPPAPVVAGP